MQGEKVWWKDSRLSGEPYSTTKKAEDIVYDMKVMRLLRMKEREKEGRKRRGRKSKSKVGWTRGAQAKAEEGGEFAQLWRGRSLLPHLLTFSRLPPPVNSSFFPGRSPERQSWFPCNCDYPCFFNLILFHFWFLSFYFIFNFQPGQKNCVGGGKMWCHGQ